jgi:hypothetical protein
MNNFTGGRPLCDHRHTRHGPVAIMLLHLFWVLSATRTRPRAGPPAKLALSLAATVQHGASGTLGTLEVLVTDAWGNPSPMDKDFEVTLKPQAVATDASGRSAKVTARGSNRAKLRNGAATFYDVKLKADADGKFALAVYCKSRNVVRMLSCAARIVPSTMLAALAHAFTTVAAAGPFMVGAQVGAHRAGAGRGHRRRASAAKQRGA